VVISLVSGLDGIMYEVYFLVIGVIRNRNWIDIWCSLTLASSLNANEFKELQMNAATTTAASTPATQKTGLSRLLQTFRTELRRAFELAGAPYKDGILPPL
jgi:hypothetical protein